MASYLKNLGSSLGYASLDAFKEMMPTITDTVTDNVNFIKENFTTIKDYVKSDDGLRNSKYIKASKSLIQNALEELKTGNIYTKEKQEEMFNAMGESLGMDMSMFDEMDNLLNDDDDGDNFSMSSDSNTESSSDTDSFSDFDMDDDGSSTTYSNETTNNNVITTNNTNVLNTVSNSTGKATNSILAASSKAVLESMQLSTSALIEKVHHIEQFQNEQTVQFYNDVSEKLTNIGDLVKSVSSAFLPKEDASSSTTNLAGDLASRGLNLDFLKDVFKSNSDDGMLSMLMDSAGGALEGFSKNPLGTLMKMGITTLVPKSIKDSLGSLDKFTSEEAPFLLQRLFGKMADSDNNILSAIGEKFIVDTKRKNKKDDFSQYEKGAIPFDGETKRSIIFQIPVLLSKILKHVSGISGLNGTDEDGNTITEDLVYNEKSGTFINRKDYQELFNYEENDVFERTTKDLQETILNGIDEYTEAEEEAVKDLVQKLIKAGENTTSAEFDKLFESTTSGSARVDNLVRNNGRLQTMFARTSSEYNQNMDKLQEERNKSEVYQQVNAFNDGAVADYIAKRKEEEEKEREEAKKRRDNANKLNRLLGRSVEGSIYEETPTNNFLNRISRNRDIIPHAKGGEIEVDSPNIIQDSNNRSHLIGEAGPEKVKITPENVNSSESEANYQNSVLDFFNRVIGGINKIEDSTTKMQTTPIKTIIESGKIDKIEETVKTDEQGDEQSSFEINRLQAEKEKAEEEAERAKLDAEAYSRADKQNERINDYRERTSGLENMLGNAKANLMETSPMKYLMSIRDKIEKKAKKTVLGSIFLKKPGEEDDEQDDEPLTKEELLNKAKGGLIKKIKTSILGNDSSEAQKDLMREATEVADIKGGMTEEEKKIFINEYIKLNTKKGEVKTVTGKTKDIVNKIVDAIKKKQDDELYVEATEAADAEGVTDKEARKEYIHDYIIRNKNKLVKFTKDTFKKAKKTVKRLLFGKDKEEIITEAIEAANAMEDEAKANGKESPFKKEGSREAYIHMYTLVNAKHSKSVVGKAKDLLASIGNKAMKGVDALLFGKSDRQLMREATEIADMHENWDTETKQAWIRSYVQTNRSKGLVGSAVSGAKKLFKSAKKAIGASIDKATRDRREMLVSIAEFRADEKGLPENSKERNEFIEKYVEDNMDKTPVRFVAKKVKGLVKGIKKAIFTNREDREKLMANAVLAAQTQGLEGPAATRFIEEYMNTHSANNNIGEKARKLVNKGIKKVKKFLFGADKEALMDQAVLAVNSLEKAGKKFASPEEKAKLIMRLYEQKANKKSNKGIAQKAIDKIKSKLEKRKKKNDLKKQVRYKELVTKGLTLAEARGKKGKEAEDFAIKYADEHIDKSLSVGDKLRVAVKTKVEGIKKGAKKAVKKLLKKKTPEDIELETAKKISKFQILQAKVNAKYQSIKAKVREKFKDFWEAKRQAKTTTTTTLGDALREKIKTAGERARSGLSNLWNGFRNVVGTVIDAAGKGIGAVASALSSSGIGAPFAIPLLGAGAAAIAGLVALVIKKAKGKKPGGGGFKFKFPSIKGLKKKKKKKKKQKGGFVSKIKEKAIGSKSSSMDDEDLDRFKGKGLKLSNRSKKLLLYYRAVRKDEDKKGNGHPISDKIKAELIKSLEADASKQGIDTTAKVQSNGLSQSNTSSANKTSEDEGEDSTKNKLSIEEVLNRHMTPVWLMGSNIEIGTGTSDRASKEKKELEKQRAEEDYKKKLTDSMKTMNETLATIQEQTKNGFSNTSAVGTSGSADLSGISNFSGSSNAEIAWNFFKSKGLSNEAVAGILGNLQQESGIRADAVQGGMSVDNPLAGKGIAQWTEGRWKSLKDFANNMGTDEWDIKAQLEYLWQEISGGETTGTSILNKNYGGFDNFTKMTDINLATEAYEKSFERAGKPLLEKRQQYAKEFYDLYSGNTSTASITPEQLDARQQNMVKLISSFEGQLEYNQNGPRNPEAGSADCSSLTRYVYNKVLGVDIGGNTDAQYTTNVLYDVIKGNIDEAKLMPGDLLFYDGNSSHTDGVGHVEMYVGNGQMMGHGGGKGPKYHKLTNKFGSQNFLKARRWIGFLNGASIPAVSDSGSSSSSSSSSDTSFTSSSVKLFSVARNNTGESFEDLAKNYSDDDISYTSSYSTFGNMIGAFNNSKLNSSSSSGNNASYASYASSNNIIGNVGNSSNISYTGTSEENDIINKIVNTVSDNNQKDVDDIKSTVNNIYNTVNDTEKMEYFANMVDILNKIETNTQNISKTNDLLEQIVTIIDKKDSNSVSTVPTNSYNPFMPNIDSSISLIAQGI